MSEYLTFDDALKAAGRKYVDVEIPELGGKLRIRELAAGRSLEFRELQARIKKGEDLERKSWIALLVGAVVNGDGKPMFNEKQAGQFIDEASILTLQTLLKAIMEMIAPPPANKDEPPGN